MKEQPGAGKKEVFVNDDFVNHGGGVYYALQKRKLRRTKGFQKGGGCPCGNEQRGNAGKEIDNIDGKALRPLASSSKRCPSEKRFRK